MKPVKGRPPGGALYHLNGLEGAVGPLWAAEWGQGDLVVGYFLMITISWLASFSLWIYKAISASSLIEMRCSDPIRIVSHRHDII